MSFLFFALLVVAAFPDASAATAQASAEGYPGRPQREMLVLYNDVSGYEISIDNDPTWRYQVGVSGRAPAMFMATPPLVVPMLAMAVVDNQVTMEDESKMPATTRMAFDIMGRKFAASDDLGSVESATYGDLNGHEVLSRGRVGNEPVEVQLFIGRNQQSVVYTLSAYTKAGMREHLRESTRRIWGSIVFRKAPRASARPASRRYTEQSDSRAPSGQVSNAGGSDVRHN